MLAFITWKVKCYSLIQLFEHLLYVSDTSSGARDTAVNKTYKLPLLKEPIFRLVGADEV